MNTQQDFQLKKRKATDDAEKNESKKTKTVEEYTQHLREKNVALKQKWDQIAEMDPEINELDRKLYFLKRKRSVEREEYRKELEKLKEESCPPEGITQPDDLFEQDLAMFETIMAHLREIEGDTSSHKAFVDFLNIITHFECSGKVSGIGPTYSKRIREARPISDFEQVQKILGKKRATTIALKFEQHSMYRYNPNK
ncbi:Oidioi.mRNA.OKI2018_I69.XSR.g16761.t1.cds [Oikopleura dioica]|uniref:Oidioi.mRNA.OKI2018_I69.XSR.g16761.t1.cds n=1 Tax=Oikopleura dioica TaxID=34765 RepID=A0ABN7SJ06_OIKDI|nr:Oidioi.mRNA.OKI2018_I69.XSR.g16761.t1.cds [Oikopleura dioica]